jgi:DNA-binding NarL/FixJ family response regulator
MRVVLVGRADERARVRAELLHARIEVAAEFDSLAEAEAMGPAAEAVMIVAQSRESAADGDEEHWTEPLTAREIQVLELLADGLPNKRIAQRLGISDQTVKFHVASITGKLGAANRTDAVRRALRRGLISL